MSWIGEGMESNTDRVGVLREDHEKLKELFVRFNGAQDPRSMQVIVDEALRRLIVHAQVEEEIFYPAFREAHAEDQSAQAAMDEALQEHHVAKLLIGELAAMKPGEEFYAAKFTVLAESIQRHIREEETGVFLEIDAGHSMWMDLDRRMRLRREELMQDKAAFRKTAGPSARPTPRTRRLHRSARTLSKGVAAEKRPIRNER